MDVVKDATLTVENDAEDVAGVESAEVLVVEALSVDSILTAPSHPGFGEAGRLAPL